MFENPPSSVKALYDAVKAHVSQALKPLAERVDKLERASEGLERKSWDELRSALDAAPAVKFND